MLDNIISLSSGYRHSLALSSTGQVFAWGNNKTGQLANAGVRHSQAPMQIEGLGNAIQIYSGYNHSFALMEDGTVYAWGYNKNGELGLGHFQYSVGSPHRIEGLSQVSYMICGAHHCFAVLKDGKCYAWGKNARGQLGLGHNTNQAHPHLIEFLEGADLISCGNHHSFALKNNVLYAWGYNGYGQLGFGHHFDINTPQQLQLDNVSDIVCGGLHTIAIMHDGTCYSWGKNRSGELGIGHKEDSSTPVRIEALSNVQNVFCGAHHSFAILNDMTCYAWGENKFGQCGIITDDPEIIYPEKVSLGCNVHYVNCGYLHSLAVLENGTCVSFGYNDFGQLGLGTAEKVKWFETNSISVDDTFLKRNLKNNLFNFSILNLLYDYTLREEFNSEYRFLIQINAYQGESMIFHKSLLEIRAPKVLLNLNIFEERKRPLLDIEIFKEYIYLDRIILRSKSKKSSILESLVYCLDMIGDMQLACFEAHLIQKICDLIAQTSSTLILLESLQTREDLSEKTKALMELILGESPEEYQLQEPLSTYSEDLELFSTMSDLNFVFESEHIPVKKSVIILFSEYFEKLVQLSVKESDEYDLVLPTSKYAIKSVLQFLHTLKVPDEISSDTCFEIMRLVDYIRIKDQVAKDMKPLLFRCTTIIQSSAEDEDFYEYLETVDFHEIMHFKDILPKELLDRYNQDVSIYRSITSNPEILNLKQAISSIQEEISTVSTNVSSLSSQLNTVESRVSSIEENLEKILELLSAKSDT